MASSSFSSSSFDDGKKFLISTSDQKRSFRGRMMSFLVLLSESKYLSNHRRRHICNLIEADLPNVFYSVRRHLPTAKEQSLWDRLFDSSSSDESFPQSISVQSQLERLSKFVEVDKKEADRLYLLNTHNCNDEMRRLEQEDAEAATRPPSPYLSLPPEIVEGHLLSFLSYDEAEVQLSQPLCRSHLNKVDQQLAQETVTRIQPHGLYPTGQRFRDGYLCGAQADSHGNEQYAIYDGCLHGRGGSAFIYGKACTQSGWDAFVKEEAKIVEAIKTQLSRVVEEHRNAAEWRARRKEVIQEALDGISIELTRNRREYAILTTRKRKRDEEEGAILRQLGMNDMNHAALLEQYEDRQWNLNAVEERIKKSWNP